VDGEIQIEGRDLFVRVMSYIPAPKNENRFEIHRIYADVQYIVEGIERMFTAGMNDLTSCSEYDAKGDSHFFKASQPSSDLVVCAGEFAVFYPYQAHCPSCCYEGHNGVVKKLVFKVKIN
jgi:YhcH/YjgK/YiaL family protein